MINPLSISYVLLGTSGVFYKGGQSIDGAVVTDKQKKTIISVKAALSVRLSTVL